MSVTFTFHPSGPYVAIVNVSVMPHIWYIIRHDNYFSPWDRKGLFGSSRVPWTLARIIMNLKTASSLLSTSADWTQFHNLQIH